MVNFNLVNTKKIRLFGHEMIIAERIATDALNVADFTTGLRDVSLTVALGVYLTISEDGLRLNRRPVSLWAFWRYRADRRFNRMLKAKYLRDHLTPDAISRLANEVMKLEEHPVDTNGESKKKVNPRGQTLAAT